MLSKFILLSSSDIELRHVQYLAHLSITFILYTHLILLFGYGTDSTLWSTADNGAVGRCPSTNACVGMILLPLLSLLLCGWEWKRFEPPS